MTPLQLTHFEELMYWENHPAYPCNVFVRARFSGKLHRGDVETALLLALGRHPLLRSKIERRGRRWFWVLSEEKPELTWTDLPHGPGDDFPSSTHINLQEEIGLRVCVHSGTQTSDMTLQFHHSCCDGAGFLAFLQDWLVFYARQRGAELDESRLPNYDPRRLSNRARYGLTWWKLLKLLPRQLIGLQGVKQFMARAPQPLHPHSAHPTGQSPPAQYPSGARHVFTVDETIRFRQIAQLQNVTTNDLLARNLFLAIFQWRQEQGLGIDHEWLRMMVPMDLRTAADREMPAANIVSSVFLDRRSIDSMDSEQLLASIHDEMQLIKRNQLGLTFLFSLRLFDWLPGGIRKSVKTDRCTISFIFTNVGKALARTPLPKRSGRLLAGDVMLEGLQALVPLRPYNCAAFCVHQYAGKLVMDLHYDSGVLASDHARRIIENFVAQSLAMNVNSSVAEPIR